MSGSASAILRLDPGRLRDTAWTEAATVITTASARLNTLAAVAFDSAGALWISALDEPVLLAFEPDALASSGSKPARTMILPVTGTIRSPTGLAFDSQQRLWVANEDGTLNRFDVGQLASGGAQQPAVVVTIAGHASALAFAADGSLWVADNLLNVIRKFSPAQLASSGAPIPAVVLTANGLSLANPVGLAFDADGNLWVANSGGRTLASFSPTRLRSTGTPTPDVLITSNGGALSIPVGLAFDALGDLWVVGGTGALTKYSRASLGTSGATKPALRTQIAQHSLFWSVAFWPIPTGLPLGQRSP